MSLPLSLAEQAELARQEGDQEQQRARAELARRSRDERCRYYRPCGEIQDGLKLISQWPSRDGRTRIWIVRGPNSGGKTALAANLAAYLCDRISNPYFDSVPILRGMPRPNRGRLLTTANAAKTTYGDEVEKWFPRSLYTKAQAGRHYDSEFELSRTKSKFDIFTFDQDPSAGESLKLDWAIIDEPLPQHFWRGLKFRFREGGLIVFVMTALEGSAWIADQLEVPERIGDDVLVTVLSACANCREHGRYGVIPHVSLVDAYKDCDEAELTARRDGNYLHLTGTVYSTYRQGFLSTEGAIVGHEMPELAGPGMSYYAEKLRASDYTLYNVADPHDRKPWALGWYAVFPNGDVVCVAEWPDEAMPPFHKIKSWPWGPEKYAELIRATETALGKRADKRIMDPNFGPAPKATDKSSVQERMIQCGRAIGWRLYYELGDDDLPGGHLNVKQLLGDPAKGLRPKFYTLPHCKNHRFGLSHYAWREGRDERRGLSETPELIHKDMPDLVRYLANKGAKYRQQEERAAALLDYERMGNGYKRVRL